MSISVQNVVKDSDTSSYLNLIAGHQGLDRQLNNISVMEVDDFPDYDLSHGLFVLTTFSFSRNDMDKANDIFIKLINKEISALAIKLNRYIKEVPQSLIDTSNQYNVPLFVVDSTTAFSKIINDISFLTNKVYFEDVSSLNQRYEVLYNAINNGEPLNYFIDSLSSTIQKPVLCTDSSLNILSSSTKEISESTLSTILQIDLRTINLEETQWISGNIYMIPCIGYHGLIGLLFIKTESELTNLERTTISQFNRFITMRLVDTNLSENFMRRERARLIQEIVHFDNFSEEEVKLKLATIDFRIAESYQLIFIKYPEKMSKQYLQSYVKSILMTELNDQDYILEFVSEGLLIILNVHSPNSIKPEYYPTKIYQSLLSLDIDELYVGFNDFQRPIRCFSKSFQAIDNSIEVSKLLDSTQHLVNVNDYIDFQLLFEMKGTDAYLNIEQNIIDPISRLDNNKDGKYWDTLKQCILSENIQQAANKLYVHKTTVKYRLEKIQEITNLNFLNPIHRIHLTHAFMMHLINIIEKEV